MVRTLSAACVLVLCGTGAAHAQDAAGYVDAISAYSAQISPRGKEVALIRRTDDAQQLLVADLAAKTSRVVQSVKEKSKYAFDWVRLKDEELRGAGKQVKFIRVPKTYRYWND